jgi:signal peptidase II
VNRNKFVLLACLTFIVNYGLDRLGKYLAGILLKGRGPVRVIGDFFILTYTENKGAFLSLGMDWPVALKYAVFIILPIIACLGALYYVLVRETRMYRIALIVTIASGGMGNLVDRLFNEFRVVDFMNFGIGRLRTGILNIADLSITFGLAALIVRESRTKK